MTLLIDLPFPASVSATDGLCVSGLGAETVECSTGKKQDAGGVRI